jgi:hypothetical protein
MGCGMSTEEKEGKARNEEIENQLKRDKMMQRNEIKMLLLGMSANYFGHARLNTLSRQDCCQSGRFLTCSQVLVNLESQLSSSR